MKKKTYLRPFGFNEQNIQLSDRQTDRQTECAIGHAFSWASKF